MSSRSTSLLVQTFFGVIRHISGQLHKDTRAICLATRRLTDDDPRISTGQSKASFQPICRTFGSLLVPRTSTISASGCLSTANDESCGVQTVSRVGEYRLVQSSIHMHITICSPETGKLSLTKNISPLHGIYFRLEQGFFHLLSFER